MGSLPPSDLPNGTLKKDILTLDALGDLFNSQKRYIDNFFLNLDVAEAHRFLGAVSDATGTIFFTGVGKSGFVAQKIAQTLVSLGTKSAFLSPTDALHGDIGALSAGDLLVFFSKSGSSDELIRLVPCARSRGAFLVAITSAPASALAVDCDLSVHLPLEKELCPFNLAPVTSPAIQMLFGDTIAAAIMNSRNLTREEYAGNHPAGRIGKSLIFKVKDMMKKQEDLPVCKEGDLIINQLFEHSSKGFGCLLVVDDKYHLIGTFTDGDLRRALDANREAIFKLRVGDVCNRHPRTIGPEAMAVDAMKKMESPPSPVQFLPVITDENVVIGLVTLHGLVSAGL